MQSFIINERPLTDDVLQIADEGKAFPGGYVAILTFHTFRNAWSDDEHRRSFRTMDNAERFITKRYGKSIDELIYDTPEED